MNPATPAKRPRHGAEPFLALLVAGAALLLGACREPGRSPAPGASPATPRVAAAPGPAQLGTARVAAAVELGPAPPPLPRWLSETGLYLPGRPLRIDPANVRFTPRYPLWTDGADKARFIRVPAGEAIDASDPEHFRFPIGTRLWKEFAFHGRRAETRFIERLADGSFRYASYRWNEAGTDAELVSRAGERGAVAIAPGVFHDLPAEDDCRACHEGRPARVLGFSALQLGSELGALSRKQLVVNLPAALRARPHEIAAPSAVARAALGYLYGNCSHCHNAEGPLRALGLDFDQPLASSDGYERIRESALGRPSQFRPAGAASLRIAPQRPSESTLLLRMQARDPVTQMPPLGTKLVDRAAIDLVTRFIAHELTPTPFLPSGGSS